MRLISSPLYACRLRDRLSIYPTTSAFTCFAFPKLNSSSFIQTRIPPKYLNIHITGVSLLLEQYCRPVYKWWSACTGPRTIPSCPILSKDCERRLKSQRRSTLFRTGLIKPHPHYQRRLQQQSKSTVRSENLVPTLLPPIPLDDFAPRA